MVKLTLIVSSIWIQQLSKQEPQTAAPLFAMEKSKSVGSPSAKQF